MVEPKNIPQHLQGQIYDVKSEPDGGVSFQHPAGNVGFDSQEMNRVRLDPNTAKATFDNSYRMQNPDDSALQQYSPMRKVPMQERLERGIAGWLKQKGSELTGTPGKNVATAGLLSALAAGAGGAWLANRNDEPMLDKALLFALLGGGLGAGVSAFTNLSGKRFLADQDNGLRKSASADAALMYDQSLDQQQKLILASAMGRLPYDEKETLNRLVAQAGGAAVGVIIARYLGMRGLISPLIMAVIGASAGGFLAQKPQNYTVTGSTLI